MRQALGVDGESLDELLAMLPYFEFEETRGGLVNFKAEAVPHEVGVPFFRALMRREARLLQEDADVLADSVVEWRTQTQRRADAFLELVESILAAARYRRHRPDEPSQP